MDRGQGLMGLMTRRLVLVPVLVLSRGQGLRQGQGRIKQVRWTSKGRQVQGQEQSQGQGQGKGHRVVTGRFNATIVRTVRVAVVRLNRLLVLLLVLLLLLMLMLDLLLASHRVRKLPAVAVTVAVTVALGVAIAMAGAVAGATTAVRSSEPKSCSTATTRTLS